MKDCDDCAVEAPWAKCKQILHPAIGEMSVSFKGFIVSKLFTGKMLHIYTGNKKVGVIQGWSWTERCSVCFPAVCSYGSMLLIEGNLAKHRSLTSLLSLSQCGFGLFFYSFFSLAILITQNNFTKPLLLRESAAAVCCLPPLYNQNGVPTKTDMWLTMTDQSTAGQVHQLEAESLLSASSWCSEHAIPHLSSLVPSKLHSRLFLHWKSDIILREVNCKMADMLHYCSMQLEERLYFKKFLLLFWYALLLLSLCLPVCLRSVHGRTHTCTHKSEHTDTRIQGYTVCKPPSNSAHCRRGYKQIQTCSLTLTPHICIYVSHNTWKDLLWLWHTATYWSVRGAAVSFFPSISFLQHLTRCTSVHIHFKQYKNPIKRDPVCFFVLCSNVKDKVFIYHKSSEVT